MDKQQLIDNLNKDLAAEFAAVIQYITYAARVTGPYRPQLVQFFLAEVPDEQGHAQFLANKIVALGGVPTVTPEVVPAVTDAKSMLRAVLEAESRAVEGYKQRADEANAFGDKGLAVQLETMIADETGHMEETARILQDWSMV